MILACEYVVIFVLRGSLAEELQSLSEGRNVVIVGDCQSIWDLPHLKGKKDSFCSRQIQLHEPLGLTGTKTGEPRSWGAWSSKAFLWSEAIKLDPFKTSHFVWLDARTPLVARRAFPNDQT